MDQRVRLITHKGKDILFADYSGLNGSDYLSVLELTMEKYRKLIPPKKKSGLLLIDNTNSSLGDEQLVQLKQNINKLKDHVIGIAALGLDGLKKYFFDVLKSKYISNIKGFESAEDAKDWLVDL